MRLLFYLGHPAHYHFLKNVIRSLERNGHHIIIVIKSKDVLENILSREGHAYINIAKKTRGQGRAAIITDLTKRIFKLFSVVFKHKPDMMIGSIAEITHVGTILRIPSLVPLEDDLAAVPEFDRLASRWASCLITPESCDVGQWGHKTIKYNSYQELAYLHPDYFKPDLSLISEIVDTDNKIFVIRLSKLSAYHDKGKTGITDEMALKIVRLLEPHGSVYITSERELGLQLEKYRINISPVYMLDLLYYADLYIGDSQTMTAEAAVLGTPSIRYNDFVGKLGYLEDLEHSYDLTYGIKTNEPEKLYGKIEEILAIPESKAEWGKRRDIMLNEKIDVTSFLTWFIENYPVSFNTMSDDPDYQYSFRAGGKR